MLTQRVALILSMNVDQNRCKQFSIAICRPTGKKWQLKTLFLAIFDSRSSIVKSICDWRLPGVVNGAAKSLAKKYQCDPCAASNAH